MNSKNILGSLANRTAKIKLSLVWGIFITVVFMTLLVIRLDLFQKQQESISTVSTSAVQRPHDSWLNIYQNKKKIGVVHRTFTALNTGFHYEENIFMQLRTMGVTQALSIQMEGDLNPDLTLSSFSFDLFSSLFRFHAHGFVVKDKLILYVGLPHALQKSEFPLQHVPHMSGSIYDAAFRADLEKDATRSFSIFDPATLALRSVQVTRAADEIISVTGKRILAKKYCADFMGAKNCAWLGQNGETLKEAGILGLSLEKTTREKAQEGIATDGKIDFSQIASIPANAKIDQPENISRLKVKISGTSGFYLYLHGDRQSFSKGFLTIAKEQLDKMPPADNAPPKNMAAFLEPSPLVQAHDPQIKAQLAKIVQPSDSAEQKIRKVISWVYRNIEKKPVLSVPNALEVLKNKTGDCNEHAVLVAALLRTAGIPAQIETGLVYMRGRFYYHAWNVAYLGKWITADAVLNQFPADVTHIRLVRGAMSEHLDLLGVMGKIQLEIVEQIK